MSEIQAQRDRISKLRGDIRVERQKASVAADAAGTSLKKDALDAQEDALKNELAKLRGSGSPAPAPAAAKAASNPQPSSTADSKE